MPSLKDLATNLPNYRYYSGVGTFNANDIPFGNDTPGGGNSTQPFVVLKPDTRWSPSNFNDPLTQFGSIATTTRTAADIVRLSKFMYSTVQGPLFLLKQVGLQTMNPDVEQKDNMFGELRTYNPLGSSTLAEAGLVGFGQHLVKHGIIPSFGNGYSYEKYIKSLYGDEGGRLVKLTKDLSSKYDSKLMEYKGGPGSYYGIGKTVIKRYGNILNIQATKFGGDVQDSSGFIAIPSLYLSDISKITSNKYEIRGGEIPTGVTNDLGFEIADTSTNSGIMTLGTNSDYRAYKNKIAAYPKGSPLMTADYAKYNLENRVGVAKNRSKDRRYDYTQYEAGTDPIDRINAISIYYSNKNFDDSGELKDINGKEVTAKDIRDLIKFRITSYDNDKPGYGTHMVFRAYLSNIKRGIVSKWDPYKYVGRGESFYAYDGFTENITFSFVIAASSRAEMKPLYQKLNYLISTMTPDYKNNKSRGNISELTIGDYVLYQPGIITNLDMIIDEDTNWDIALTEPENGGDTSMHELPQIIRCNMTFIPIYNFLPRKSSVAPFIGIDGKRERKTGSMWLPPRTSIEPLPLKTDKIGD